MKDLEPLLKLLKAHGVRAYKTAEVFVEFGEARSVSMTTTDPAELKALEEEFAKAERERPQDALALAMQPFPKLPEE
jgi:malonyl CoA-acyl carrier protein transacylase